MYCHLSLAVEMSMPLNSSSVLEFHGDSYVELKLSNNVAKTFAYDVWFLPTKPDGTLLSFSSLFYLRTKVISMGAHRQGQEGSFDPPPWKTETFFCNRVISRNLFGPNIIWLVHAKRTQGQNYAQQAGGFSQHSRQPSTDLAKAAGGCSFYSAIRQVH